MTRSRTSPDPVPSDDVELGYISGVFGLRGEVRLHLHNPGSDFLMEPRKVGLIHPDGQRSRVLLTTRSGAGKRVLGRLDGVVDREAALALRGCVLVVAKADLPDLDEGDYYHADLVGLVVRTEDGELLGDLVEIQYRGGVDVWIIEGAGGVYFVPALKTLIHRVDADTGIVVADEVRQTHAV